MLGWAVPLILLVLVFTFVLMVLGVRTRRASATLGILAALVALVALGIVAAARFGLAAPYVATYEWINIQVAIGGSIPFQSFIVDLDLRIDHFAIAEIGTVLVTTLLVLGWSRGGARAEPGVPRLHTLVVMFALGAVGVALTPNLAGLIAYWGVAAVATYLMLSNRWAAPEAGYGRLALALPFAGDLAVLAGTALLYSRYGELDLTRLPALVPTSLGTGLKSLTAACILITAGAAVRAAVPPFQGWLTGTVTGPPAAVALVNGTWALLAGGLVFRILPLIHLAGWQAPLALAVVGGAAAVVAPATALLGNGLRRAVAVAGIGQAGLGLLALAYGDPALPLTGLLAGAPLRAGMLLAAASIAAAMRTEDIAEMGAALRRMRLSALSLGLGAVGLPLAMVAAGGASTLSRPWLAVFAAGLLLVTVAGVRAYLGAAHGTLERRRAFEPSRVREAAAPLPQVALALVLFGWLFTVLSAIPRWASYLVPGGHLATSPALVAGAAAVVLGVLLAAATYGRARRAWLARSARAGTRAGAAVVAGGALAERLVLGPGRRLAAEVDAGLVRLEVGALSPVAMAGRVLNRSADAPLPLRWVGVAVGLVALASLLAALLSPGVVR